MTSLLRFGAISGMLAGLLIALPSAVEIATGETAATSFALGLSPALGIPLVIALHLGQQPASGRLGSVAYAANVIGLGLFGGAAYALNVVLFHVDEAVVDDLPSLPRLTLLGSAIVFSIGTVLFGLSMIRARVYPRVPAIGYAVAFPLIALLAPLPDTLLISGIHIVVGIALIWLSTALRTTSRAATPGQIAVV